MVSVVFTHRPKPGKSHQIFVHWVLETFVRVAEETVFTPGRAVDETNIKSKPTTVSEHFFSHSNHSHTDMQLISLEKIHSSSALRLGSGI